MRPNSFGKARHGAPVRNAQNIPFRTRRSSTRGTPRGLFGAAARSTPFEIIELIASRDPAPPVGKLESHRPCRGNPLDEFII